MREEARVKEATEARQRREREDNEARERTERLAKELRGRDWVWGVDDEVSIKKKQLAFHLFLFLEFTPGAPCLYVGSASMSFRC